MFSNANLADLLDNIVSTFNMSYMKQSPVSTVTINLLGIIRWEITARRLRNAFQSVFTNHFLVSTCLLNS